MLVEQSIIIEASPAEVYQAITNFTAYVDILSSVDAVDVLHAGEDTWQVLFTTESFQSVEYTLDFKGVLNETLSWNLVESSLMKKNSGHYRLEQDDEGTQVEYSIDVELKLWMPGFALKRMLIKQVSETLMQFKQYIEN